MPIRKWIKSANFAIEGILHAARTERHLRYHFFAAGVVLLFSYAVGLTKPQFLIIALAVMAVLLAEMMNTAVEAIVDILAPEHHESARTAKDVAAGAVLITALGAALVGYVVLFPHVSDIFRKGFRVARHSPDEISIIAIIIVLIVVVLMKARLGKGHPLRGGMPSGHAAVAFAVWVAVTYSTDNFLASALSFLLAVIIARSRVTSGVHRVREVLLGGLVGALITFVLFKVFS
jgi:diacylglycerol kinase (ATP)